MSTELLNLGVSGMQAQSKAMSVIGNNIANNTTTGFKSGSTSFQEAFYTEGGSSPSGALQNQRGQGVNIAGVSYNWQGGIAEETGVDTHLSIIGDGFLPVLFNGELGYTRAADFNLAEDPANPGSYVMMRPNGAILLGGNAAGDANLTIADVLSFNQVPNSISIASNGEITTEPAAIATNGFLKIQQFGNPDAMLHQSGGILKEPPSGGTLPNPNMVDPGSPGAGYLFQGSLEASNVDLVQEFTSMIATQRAFQANSKSVTTADTMLETVLGLKR